MNDQTIGAPDQLAAAASAELDAIQRQLEATWDIAAGLREILLEEHYHWFVETKADTLDVEAGLAEVLAGGAERPDVKRLMLHEVQTWNGALLAAITAWDCVVEERAKQPNTFERVRMLAQSAEETLHQLRRDCRAMIRARVHAFNRHEVESFVTAQLHADCWIRHLAQLADELEHGAVDRESALVVVRTTALALMAVYDVTNLLWSPRLKGHSHSLAARLLDLAGDVTNLEQPIKRLFDESDDVVDALR
ncbi:hypothetical protein AB0B88_20865 [Micromonospora haikouensis]|uniref:hypothetical protein n=1 Tax=Micromonospora haikouensis TaxID=686309 RepID=UPI0033C436A6